MSQDPSGGDGSELRVEHVLAALHQIGTLSAQLRTALSGLDPQMVLARKGGPKGPPNPELVGACHTAPEETQ